MKRQGPPPSKSTETKKAKSCAGPEKKKMLVMIVLEEGPSDVLTVEGSVEVCDALVRALEKSQSEKCKGDVSSSEHVSIVNNFFYEGSVQGWLDDLEDELQDEDEEKYEAKALLRIKSYFGFDSKDELLAMKYEVISYPEDKIEMMGEVNFYKVLSCYRWY
jgi:hypothetical protein